MLPLVRAALAAYPVCPLRLTRLPLGFNAAFRIDAVDGGRYVLRVHRPDGPTSSMVGSELTWLAALHRETDLVVPAPVLTGDGDLLTVAADPGVPEPRTCDLLRWVDGRFVDARLTPAHLYRVGAYMAGLHTHAAGFTVPDGFDRGLVDNVTGFARSQPDNLSVEVTAHAADLVQQVHPAGGETVVRAVLTRARHARDEMGRGPEAFGLIHADLHQENYLFRGNQVGAIDFDDCGHGLLIYDLAVTLSELQHRGDYPTLRAALLAGYRTARPLPARHEAFIDTFIALRHLQLTMYAVEHRDEAMFRDTWTADLTKTLRRLEAFINT
jgi:Ser/Thr protein kinase RdoA (MazF antagonist)